MITEFTPAIFYIMAFALVIMPILTISATVYLGEIHHNDAERPRNAIIKRMFWSAVSISIVSLFIAWLALGYIIALISGKAHPDKIDFGGVVLATSFVVLEIQPYLKYRTLKSLDGNVNIVKEIPEVKQEPFDKDNTHLL